MVIESSITWMIWGYPHDFGTPHVKNGCENGYRPFWWPFDVLKTHDHGTNTNEASSKTGEFLRISAWFINGGFLSHRANPSLHPFIDGIFHDINHPLLPFSQRIIPNISGTLWLCLNIPKKNANSFVNREKWENEVLIHWVLDGFWPAFQTSRSLQRSHPQVPPTNRCAVLLHPRLLEVEGAGAAVVRLVLRVAGAPLLDRLRLELLL